MGKEIILPSPPRVIAAAVSLYPTPLFLSDLGRPSSGIGGLRAFGRTRHRCGSRIGAASDLRRHARAHPDRDTRDACTGPRPDRPPLVSFRFRPDIHGLPHGLPDHGHERRRGRARDRPSTPRNGAPLPRTEREVFLRLRLPSAAPHLLSGAKAPSASRGRSSWPARYSASRRGLWVPECRILGSSSSRRAYSPGPWRPWPFAA